MNSKSILTAVTVALIGLSASAAFAETADVQLMVIEQRHAAPGGSDLDRERLYGGFNNATDE